MAAGQMADYSCGSCGYRFEHFYREPPDELPCEGTLELNPEWMCKCEHVNPPTSMLCENCGASQALTEKIAIEHKVQCSGTAKRVYSLPGDRAPSDALNAPPTLVDVGPDGSYSHPAHPSAPVPPGFIRREMRTTQEKRAWLKDVNARDRAEWERGREREEQGYSEAERVRRSEFFQRMQTMSPAGRDLARLAIDHNNNRPRRKYTRETVLEALERNSSNREPGRNELSGWKQVRR